MSARGPVWEKSHESVDILFYHIESYYSKEIIIEVSIQLVQKTVPRSKNVTNKNLTKIHQVRKFSHSHNSAPVPKVETKPNEIVPLPVSMSNHAASLEKKRSGDFL